MSPASRPDESDKAAVFARLSGPPIARWVRPPGRGDVVSPLTGRVFARATAVGVTWHRGHHRLAADERISATQAWNVLGRFGFLAARERARRDKYSSASTIASAMTGPPCSSRPCFSRRLISETIQLTAEAVKLKTAIDLLTPALKSNLGSTDAAADAQAFLRSESDRLKVTIETLGKSYVQLTAATKGTAIEGETTNRLFAAITEAGKVLGSSNEDVGRAFVGLSQAAGGANVQTQEVRQITEAIPGLFAAWAKELGKTQSELRGLIADGGVAADQLGVLADAAKALAGDTALEEQLATTAGLFQELDVAIQNTPPGTTRASATRHGTRPSSVTSPCSTASSGLSLGSTGSRSE